MLSSWSHRLNSIRLLYIDLLCKLLCFVSFLLLVWTHHCNFAYFDHRFNLFYLFAMIFGNGMFWEPAMKHFIVILFFWIRLLRKLWFHYLLSFLFNLLITCLMRQRHWLLTFHLQFFGTFSSLGTFIFFLNVIFWNIFFYGQFFGFVITSFNQVNLSNLLIYHEIFAQCFLLCPVAF